MERYFRSIIEMEMNIMSKRFEQLFQYGFHDTELSSIDEKGLKLVLNFDKGLYLLNEEGKETVLSKPVKIFLQINSRYDSLEQVIEIREYGKKVKYIDYVLFKKYLEKEPFEIWMTYYNNFNNCILFDGGIGKRQIMFSIEEIENVIVCNQNCIKDNPK